MGSMLVRARRVVVALCLLLGAPGCYLANPLGPKAALDSTFVLAPNETATIVDTPLRIRFIGVSGDSRCPADAICIQGGDAIVRIEALTFGAGSKQYELHTGNMKPVQHEAFTIELLQLSPYPFSSKTILPDEYRAALRVSR